jgi:hypothetical protein
VPERLILQGVDSQGNTVTTTLDVPTTTDARFPGDPGPGRLYLGASSSFQPSSLTALETAIGKPLGVRPKFYTDLTTTELNSLMAQVDSDSALGRIPWVSGKPTGSYMTLATSASKRTAYRAQLTTLMQRLKVNGKLVWVTMNHEPENDDATRTQAQLVADWAVAQQILAEERDAAAADRVVLVANLMSFTFTDGSGRPWQDWAAASTPVDVVGFNRYREQGDNRPIAGTAFTQPIDRLRSVVGDVPVAIREFGIDRRHGEALWISEFQSFVATCRSYGIVGASYFNNDVASEDAQWFMGTAGMTGAYNTQRSQSWSVTAATV